MIRYFIFLLLIHSIVFAASMRELKPSFQKASTRIRLPMMSNAQFQEPIRANLYVEADLLVLEVYDVKNHVSKTYRMQIQGRSQNPSFQGGSLEAEFAILKEELAKVSLREAEKEQYLAFPDLLGYFSSVLQDADIKLHLIKIRYQDLEQTYRNSELMIRIEMQLDQDQGEVEFDFNKSTQVCQAQIGCTQKQSLVRLPLLEESEFYY